MWDDSRFSIVSVSPKMFPPAVQSQLGLSIPPDVRQTVTKLTSLRILSTETTPALFYKEALNKVDRKDTRS